MHSAWPQAAHAICENLRHGAEGEAEQACHRICHMATHQAEWLDRHLNALLPAVAQACCHATSQVGIARCPDAGFAAASRAETAIEAVKAAVL